MCVHCGQAVLRVLQTPARKAEGEAALKTMTRIVGKHPSVALREACARVRLIPKTIAVLIFSIQGLFEVFGLLDDLLVSLLQWFDDPLPSVRAAASPFVSSLPEPWCNLRTIGTRFDSCACCLHKFCRRGGRREGPCCGDGSCTAPYMGNA